MIAGVRGFVYGFVESLGMGRSFYFEGRALKDSAEPVSRAELEIGEVYYRVSFFDRDMTTPEISTLVFIGFDLKKEGEGKIYFQDSMSYISGFRYGDTDKDNAAIIFARTENQLNGLYNFTTALEILMCCSLRKKN